MNDDLKNQTIKESPKIVLLAIIYCDFVISLYMTYIKNLKENSWKMQSEILELYLFYRKKIFLRNTISKFCLGNFIYIDTVSNFEFSIRISNIDIIFGFPDNWKLWKLNATTIGIMNF